MIYYVIPARSGSKGLPYKNRLLIDFTLKALQNIKRNKIIITSNDYNILDMTSDCIQVKRSDELSNDTANIRDVLLDVVDKCELKKDDIIVNLYLTYPERSFRDIECVLKYFAHIDAKSLLCKQPVKSHPYLMIDEDNNRIFNHDLYRRQDYPEFFEISHYIAIIKISELKNLNKNLYNDNTEFYLIDRKFDIDTKEDFRRFLN